MRFIQSVLCLMCLWGNAQAAPRIPDVVLNNGLVYCTSSSNFSFNPQTADAGTSMNIVTEQIYNKLFEIKDNSDQVKPVLATNYSWSKDGKALWINLRRGVKFQTTPWFTPTRDFNADDVVFSLNRMLERLPDFPNFNVANRIDNNATYTDRQAAIYHEEAKKVRFPYFESIKLGEKIKSVQRAGKYRVKITLFQPDYSILSHLASQYAIMFSQEYALQLGADDNLSQIDSLPVGTGAYQVKSYFRNRYVRLVRNSHYWGKKPHIEHIIIDLSTNRSGRLLKFLNNECQIAAAPEVSQLGLLRQNHERYYLKSTDGMNLAYLAFNFSRPAMRDVDTRRAIAQAINRTRIINQIYHGSATIADGIIPTVSWASGKNSPDFAYGYRPLKAKAVLKPLKLHLNLWVLNEERIYNPAPLSTAELIQNDLAKAGVKVKIHYVTRTFLNQQLAQGTADYDLILTGWLTGNLDPDTFMHPILSCSTRKESTNLSHWCYRPFENALTQALQSSKKRLRSRFYNIAQEIALSEVPIIPLANVKRTLVINSRVKGLKLTSFGNVHFADLSLQQLKGKKKIGQESH